MAAIKYAVPYEFAVKAIDLGSGKPSTNLYYLRNGNATGSFAYGDPLPGSDNNTLMTNVAGLYILSIPPFMNANYKMVAFVLRSIIGKQYRTPFMTIAALYPGAPIAVVTTFPHNLHTGDFVYVRGVSGTTGANGVRQITVTSTTGFTLNGTNDAVAWGNDGEVQLASGPYQFAYGDSLTVTNTTAGGVVGDALPHFSTGSIRRLNTGVGKNFRSRVSLSPFSEADQKDGAFVAGSVTAINAGFAAWNVGHSNGATDVGAGLSYHNAISKKIAATQPLIFTTSSTWCASVTSFKVQPNMGSLLRRKPKLTAPLV